MQGPARTWSGRLRQTFGLAERKASGGQHGEEEEDKGEPDSESRRGSGSRRSLAWAGSARSATTAQANRRESMLAKALLGAKINQYEIVSELGSGGEAAVFKAVDAGSGKPAAFRIVQGVSLKELDSSRRMSRPSRKNTNAVRTELAILRRIDHPLVVHFEEVLDLASLDARLRGIAIVMEYIEGRELISDLELTMMDGAYWSGQAKAHHVFTEKQSALYFAQILSGLEYLHHHGIVHGDIKPSNILLRKDCDQIKLIDFGVSKQTSSSPGAMEDPNGHMLDCHGGFGRGTLLFFSPESCKQSKDGAQYDAKAADIWAASMTLYLMLNGHLPFHGAQQRAKVLADLTSDKELFFPNPTLLGKLQFMRSSDLLRKLLRKDPARRLADIPAIMQHKWMAFAGSKYNEFNAGLKNMVKMFDLVTWDEIEQAALPVTSHESCSGFLAFFGRANEQWEQIESKVSEMTMDAVHFGESIADSLAEGLEATKDMSNVLTSSAMHFSAESMDALGGAGTAVRRISASVCDTIFSRQSPESGSPPVKNPPTSASSTNAPATPPLPKPPRRPSA